MPPAAATRGGTSSTRPERELVASIRAELAGVEPVRACCRDAEVAGLAAGSRRRAMSPATARLAVRLRAAGSAAGRGFDWSAAQEHCRIAYLRGCFLARGSLSLAGGRTHLEFVVPMPEARVLATRLAELALPGVVRLRRGAGVVTWKNSETVMTFLRRAGASASMLDLEARLVGRSVRGQLNRAVNAEEANLRRQVLASARQIDAIDTLADSGRLATLPAPLRAVAEARLSAPEATFTDLSGRLGISRSVVQRCLSRLESLALSGMEASRRRR
jgi:DNA-binding transcriptional regulator WhiA